MPNEIEIEIENEFFFPEENDECLQIFKLFGENELLETSDSLHDN